MARRHRRSRSQGNADLELDSDLSKAFSGVAVVLLMAALCAMGVPEVKASDHRELQTRFDLLGNVAEIIDKEKKEIERDLVSTRDELAQKKQEAEEASSRAASAEGQLEPRPLDVVLAIDGSESMEPWMEEVRSSIESMAEVCARIAPRFRLGIVVYRRSATDGTVFALQVIEQTEKGMRSEGMEDLLEFCNAKTERRTIASKYNGEVASGTTGEVVWEPKLSGYLTPVNPEEGLRRSIAMLDDSNARKVLVLISDVGPWEISDPGAISPWEEGKAKAIAGLARDFSGTNARVLALFTGAGQSDLLHKSETEEFFRHVADASGGTYADDPNQIAAIVLSECFRK